MKLTEFRVDARKKMLRNREVFDYLGDGLADRAAGRAAGRAEP